MLEPFGEIVRVRHDHALQLSSQAAMPSKIAGRGELEFPYRELDRRIPGRKIFELTRPQSRFRSSAKFASVIAHMSSGICHRASTILASGISLSFPQIEHTMFEPS
jgi:hypothetical protein